MPSSDEENTTDKDLGRDLIECLFRSLIDSGQIEVGNRPRHEIIVDLQTACLEMVDDPDFDILPMFNHEEELLKRAATEVASGDQLIGITFYVIWLEHFINGVLIKSFQRAGQPKNVYMPMIRNLNIAIKLSSIWTIAGLPPVASDKMRLINQAVELRNAFVHYKWPALSREEEDRHNGAVKLVAGRMDEVVTHLRDIDNQVFWNGREREIIAAFRDDFTERKAMSPPPGFEAA